MLKNTKKMWKTLTLSLPKFVSFYHFSVPQELQISKISFAILLTKTLIDNRNGVLSLSKTNKQTKKQKKIKKPKQPRQVFLTLP